MAQSVRRRKVRSVGIIWILLAVCMIFFIIVIHQFPLLPKLWKWMIELVTILLGILLGWLSWRKKGGSRKLGVSIVNTILSVLLIIASVFIPTISNDVKALIVNETGKEETTVNIYALKTEYKSEHSDVFRERGLITSTNLDDYRNKQFVTQAGTDQENQSYVLEKLAVMFNLDAVWTNPTENVWTAVEALYNAQGDALILNAAYLTTVEEIYPNFSDETILLYSFTRTTEVEPQKPEGSLMEPFALFIAGSDSRDATLTTITRTDVDIVAIINPRQDEILLISLPRDTFIPNPALGMQNDKLTHMGIYGIMNSCDALSQWLGISLDKYVLVNFDSYTRIIDTLGGIDVENPYTFDAGNNHFAQGTIHLNGTEALSYVRERYGLSDGDFGRNEHQIIVLRAILKKALSMSSIGNFQEILSSLSGTFLTNIPTDSVFDLISEELTSFSKWNVSSRHVIGTTGMDYTASMPGQPLSVVYPDDNAVTEIRNEINQLMNP